MTVDEKESIFECVDSSCVQPQEPMTLEELKAYLKGYEDARNAIFDAVCECYRNHKTD